MKRTYLDSFISKYHLGGLISNTIWKIKDNTLSTTFTTDGKEMLGTVKFNDFTEPDAELGIIDTERLLRMLSVLNGDCNLEYQKVDERIVSVMMKDSNAEVKFTLGDLSVFPHQSSLKQIPDFEAVIEVSKESASSFVTGCNAISESNHFTIVGNEFIINYDKTKNVDMIRVPVKVVSGTETEEKSFSSEHMSKIISANKDADSISVSVSNAGLMRCVFSSKDYSSEYYLVALDK